VLEHVDDIHTVLYEIQRILQPQGRLIFTVPVTQFLEDLSCFYGVRDANDINCMFYHRNLFTPDKWKCILEENGFKVEQMIAYQGKMFTFFYRLLFVPMLGSIVTRYLLNNWKTYESKIVSMIEESISRTEAGGNIFIVASKR
jgi:ubiquinone/menaquinone biosynthesis C-methylase UbiE